MLISAIASVGSITIGIMSDIHRVDKQYISVSQPITDKVDLTPRHNPILPTQYVRVSTF